MNERWKYQIKVGFFFAIFIMLFNAVFEYREKPFLNELSKGSFWMKFLVLLLVSIFLLGYINWKGRNKEGGLSWSDIFKKKQQ